MKAAAVEGESTAVEGESTAVEGENTAVEGESTTVEGESDNVEENVSVTVDENELKDNLDKIDPWMQRKMEESQNE